MPEKHVCKDSRAVIFTPPPEEKRMSDMEKELQELRKLVLDSKRKK